MNTIMQKYLDAPFKYEFAQNPDMAPTFDIALAKGINCISLAHLVLKDLYDVDLPTIYRCSELYRDTTYFEDIDDFGSTQLGDLVWLGVANPRVSVENFTPNYKDGELTNWPDFPVKHVAIHTGENSTADNLLHATYVGKTTTVWPLQKFNEYPRYKKVYGIKRLKAQFREHN